VPITELRRNTAAVLRRLQTSDKPAVITKRGRAAAVMLRIDDYAQKERERLMLHLLFGS
jgi:prevent-host-death family protein